MKISALKDIKISDVSHNSQIKKKVLVANGDIPHITNFSRAVFPPGELASAHSHSDMTEVFFIESGTGIISVNGKDIPLEAGMCITIEPNDIHELNNTSTQDLTVIYFGVET
ncbi:cupin domain-containing protein [Paraglaciecola sp. 2405UD69-4]|uniref:cupin domain-containing protein n=1 Tax=Paraglaciecola sp. 2405UD69-4 TaxID=3391836 RepID=UPI0039C8D5E3